MIKITAMFKAMDNQQYYEQDIIEADYISMIQLCKDCPAKFTRVITARYAKSSTDIFVASADKSNKESNDAYLELIRLDIEGNKNRQKIVAELEYLKSYHPTLDGKEATDESTTQLFDANVSFIIDGCCIETAMSFGLLKIMIQSVENDLFNFDGCMLPYDVATELHPDLEELF